MKELCVPVWRQQDGCSWWNGWRRASGLRRSDERSGVVSERRSYWIREVQKHESTSPSITKFNIFSFSELYLHLPVCTFSSEAVKLVEAIKQGKKSNPGGDAAVLTSTLCQWRYSETISSSLEGKHWFKYYFHHVCTFQGRGRGRKQQGWWEM